MDMRALLLSAAMASVSVVYAQNPTEYDAARMASACEGSNNAGRGICDCIAELARGDLTAEGFMFVTAAYEKDDATTEALRSSMPLQDTLKASMFMVNAPNTCAQQQ